MALIEKFLWIALFAAVCFISYSNYQTIPTNSDIDVEDCTCYLNDTCYYCGSFDHDTDKFCSGTGEWISCPGNIHDTEECITKACR